MDDILNHEFNLYTNVDQPTPYGNDDTSYMLAGAFLSGPGLVEDWGCGTTYAKNFIIGADYRGIDGSWSKFANMQVSLVNYESKVPKILMRHVLEHNYEWRTILVNMLNSFTDRAVLILFIRPGTVDSNVSYSDPAGVPGLSLCAKDLHDILTRADLQFWMVQLHTKTPPQDYERIYFLRKRG